MISIIIFCLAAIAFIIVLIKDEMDGYIFDFTCAGVILTLFIMVFSLLSGMKLTYYEIESYENEKIEIIENMDLDNVTIEDLSKIKNHNIDVNFGNNYFCRFKLEDRNLYLIDYDYYEDLHNKQFSKKIES